MNKIICVVRPENPDLTMKLIDEGKTPIDDILLYQPYKFVGIFSSANEKIQDFDGNIIDEIKTGDSLVSFDTEMLANLNIGDMLEF